jgi:hypothetical protein
MTAWDIDPYGVQSVINRTAAAFKPIERHTKTFVNGSRDAAAASGSMRVAQALSGFVQHHRGTLAGISRRTGRAMQGAADAATSYVQGDLEMSAQTRSTAAGAEH